ncbi:MAG TPA: ankyrin repeat domain-containing protein, partial [Pyrinomonadaceae bacterium]|nr:ankyrin repeat domain-containing protein [Pyrinomonadaceae bacterium]
ERLLQYGAEVDAHRDDGFTPLLLATFFGHLETVQMLVEHGANLDQTTRCGNSAEGWAKARAFAELAEYLHDARRVRKTPAPVLFKSSPERTPTKPVVVAGVFSDQARKSSAEPALQPQPEIAEPEIKLPEVRTLKDPPEIWELVHSAPPQFSPGTAFITRATSSWTNRILFLLFLCAVAMGSAYAIMKFRNGPKANLPVESAKTVPAPTETKPIATTPGAIEQSQPTSVSTQSNEPIVLPATDQNIANAPAGRIPGNGRAAGKRIRVIEAGDSPNFDNTVKSVNETPPIAPKPPERSTSETADSSVKKKVAPGGLSPQLIGPASPGPTPKPKVIQWP